MSKELHNHVPLSEANTSRLRTVAQLPFDMDERVGLDTKRIHTLLQLGGFSTARIAIDWDKEPAKTSPQIVGMNVQGNAFAGQVKTKDIRVDEHDTEQIKAFIKQSNWPHLTVTLHGQEMQKRILDSGKSARKPESWAQEMNAPLKRAIITAGVKHLLSVPNFEKVLWAAYYLDDIAIGHGGGIFRLMTSSVELHPADPWNILGNFALSAFFTHFIYSLPHGSERSGKGKRFSLFLGWEIDRAVILGGLGATSTLVRPFNSIRHK